MRDFSFDGCYVTVLLMNTFTLFKQLILLRGSIKKQNNQLPLTVFFWVVSLKKRYSIIKVSYHKCHESSPNGFFQQILHLIDLNGGEVVKESIGVYKDYVGQHTCPC